MMFYEKERSAASAYLLRELNENLNYKRHMHSSFEYIDVISGELRLTVADSDEEYVIDSKKAAMLLPYQVHSYRSVGETKCVMIIFSADYVKTFYDMIKNYSSDDPVFDYSNEQASLNLLGSDDLLMIKSYLYAVCSEFRKQTKFTEHTNSYTGLLEKTLEYIGEHYAENITLMDIANEYSYSYHYLSSFFNAKIGINFKRFLNEFRIHQACIILKDESLSITEAAYRSGYDSLRSFNREFQRIMNMTPSEYRRQMHEMSIV